MTSKAVIYDTFKMTEQELLKLLLSKDYKFFSNNLFNFFFKKSL